MLLAALLAAQLAKPIAAATPASGPVAIQEVRVSRDAAGALISITAAGSLPAPTVGVLDSPDRIYLDFPGVTTRTAGGRQPDELIAGVRAAVHSARPLVTRVVLDLHRPAAHSLDASQRTSGRIDVRLSVTAAAPPAAPRPPASVPRPAPVATPATVATPPAAPRPPASVPHPAPVAQPVPKAPKTSMRSVLDRFDALRSVLEAVDRRSITSPSSLKDASMELQRLREQLAAIRPAPQEASFYALVRNAATLAANALSLAGTGTDGSVPMAAASAAAGALMLLDRARADLTPLEEKRK